MKEIYQKTIEELYKEFNTSNKGLKSLEYKKLLKKFGKNVLVERNKKTKFEIFIKQFKNIMIILLLVVGFLSLIYSVINKSDFLEPIVILGTSIINCFMGFLQESKAEDAIGKLKKYTTNYVSVKRNNKFRKIDAKNLVVGDIILLEAGDKIPADARIIESYYAKTDESILTGESLNVDKNSDVILKKVSISERTNMVFSGTILVAGKVQAIVIATGMNTELGKIAQVIDNDEEPLTPLQIKVEKISKFITVIAGILVAFVLIYGVLNHYTVLNIIMLCVSMIVASVPECLPIAITATLSIGVSEMAKKKSIVRNLAAIETLGATNVICTDKTGTITENKLEVIDIYTSNNSKSLNDNMALVHIMNMCNSAHKNDENEYYGDSVDVAIKNYLNKYKLDNFNFEVIHEMPFDSNRKMMSVICNVSDKIFIYTKGSFESILKQSTHVLINDRVVKLDKLITEKYTHEEKNMASNGIKVLAFAYKELRGAKDYSSEENDLILVGLVGLKDPIRENITLAINTCKKANIRPIMLTGDNLETATSIAKEVGICKSDKECINASQLDHLSDDELKKFINDYSVFARVSPGHKLKIVKVLQSEGKVVAMTGDGVNDAPAIKLANVGIGMGKSGTDVTKDVSDIILLDDSYNTITTAVGEGRRIYDNVITNILYNLSSNFTEIVIILIGMLTGNTIISAIHVLYIDLIADTIPSIALAFESASNNIMDRKPNGLYKKIFTSYFTTFLIISVILEAGISLFVYYHFLEIGTGVAQTLALLSVVINEFVFVYNCRSLKEQIYKKGIFSNKYLNFGILGLLLVQILVFFTPIGKLFGLVEITLTQFLYVMIINICSFIIIELIKPFIVRKFEDN